MAATISTEPVTRTPLEDFLRDYVETIGGAWDEVEPQVYDLLLPAEGRSNLEAAESGVVRVAFDPEAIPEHPGAQLASFGTPFVNSLLTDAMERGRFAEFHTVGLNLMPHDLAPRVRRVITLVDGLTLQVARVRPMLFHQAVYWFEAEFVSDQKEQEIIPVAIDLHYGRQVRHLEQLLDHSRLSDIPAQPLPEIRRLSVTAAYPSAREEALRTFATMANTRNRELHERLDRQIGRMERYYADLRSEVAEQEKACQGAVRNQAQAKETPLRGAGEDDPVSKFAAPAGVGARGTAADLGTPPEEHATGPSAAAATAGRPTAKAARRLPRGWGEGNCPAGTGLGPTRGSG